ncbi:Uncharacterised protein [Chlamydia trachomatis]|nr:Uncharacterised protein [Chlamydia trachomatis]
MSMYKAMLDLLIQLNPVVTLLMKKMKLIVLMHKMSKIMKLMLVVNYLLMMN